MELNTEKIFKEFKIDRKCGFAVSHGKKRLPEPYDRWQDLAVTIIEKIKDHTFRDEVDRMRVLDVTGMDNLSYEEQRMLHVILGLVTMAYVWQEGEKGVMKSLPRQLAIPFCKVSEMLGLPPILGAVSLLGANWAYLDESKPPSYENIQTLWQIGNYNASESFVKVHLDIEFKYTKAIEAILTGMQGVMNRDDSAVIQALTVIHEVINNEVNQCMHTMKEKLNPSDFYHVMRPFLSGWGGEGNALPDGLIYEGVYEDGQPRKCVGGSAAQIPEPQCIDAALGIEHHPDKTAFLMKMREYMLPCQREFLNFVECGPSIRKYVLQSQNPELEAMYNKVVDRQTDFRTEHIKVVTSFVIIPSQKKNQDHPDQKYLAEHGTGGSVLMPFLKDVRDTTSKAKVTASHNDADTTWRAA